MSKKREFIKKYCKNKTPIEITFTNNPIGEKNSQPLTYIQLNNYKVKTTKQISDSRVYIDFDRRGRVVGIEII